MNDACRFAIHGSDRAGADRAAREWRAHIVSPRREDSRTGSNPAAVLFAAAMNRSVVRVFTGASASLRLLMHGLDRSSILPRLSATLRSIGTGGEERRGSRALVRARQRGFGARARAQGRDFNVAKKVFPVHLEVRDRRIVDALAERDNVSRAEAIRRIIRSFKIDVIAGESTSLAPATDNAH